MVLMWQKHWLWEQMLFLLELQHWLHWETTIPNLKMNTGNLVLQQVLTMTGKKVRTLPVYQRRIPNFPRDLIQFQQEKNYRITSKL